jgi:hypothetical protein
MQELRYTDHASMLVTKFAFFSHEACMVLFPWPCEQPEHIYHGILSQPVKIGVWWCIEGTPQCRTLSRHANAAHSFAGGL